MSTVLAPERTGNSGSSSNTAPPPPRFIVQHATPGHWQLASVDSGGKSVDGVDYTDFAAAAFERDRLNAEYWAQVAR